MGKPEPKIDPDEAAFVVERLADFRHHAEAPDPEGKMADCQTRTCRAARQAADQLRALAVAVTAMRRAKAEIDRVGLAYSYRKPAAQVLERERGEDPPYGTERELFGRYGGSVAILGAVLDAIEGRPAALEKVALEPFEFIIPYEPSLEQKRKPRCP